MTRPLGLRIIDRLHLWRWWPIREPQWPADHYSHRLSGRAPAQGSDGNGDVKSMLERTLAELGGPNVARPQEPGRSGLGSDT